MKLQDFKTGDRVHVKHTANDLWNHPFDGRVVEVNNAYIMVEDQEGNRWDCDVSQIELQN